MAKGIAGERSGLWTEMYRIIGQVKPSFAIIENSPLLLRRGFEAILQNLAQIGYNAQWQCISNSDFGYPHQRERVYIIAYSSKIRQQTHLQTDGCFDSIFREWASTEHSKYTHAKRIYEIPTVNDIRNGDGFQHWTHRVEAIGNSVNPTIAHYLFWCIQQFLKQDPTTPNLAMMNNKETTEATPQTELAAVQMWCEFGSHYIKPKPGNVQYDGFRDADTNWCVCNGCKAGYYINKNKGEYGKSHANKYSEIPLPILTPTASPKKELAAAKPKQPAATSINESYPGGKNGSGIAQFLINQIPPVDCIVSGFLGHCSVLKNIKPTKLMVGIDTNKHVIDTWAKAGKDIKLINDSFLNQTHWVNPVASGKTLVFIDAPYLAATRKSKAQLYNTEFSTEEQHTQLLQRVVKFPCFVMITHYECELYDKILLPKGFRKIRFKNNTRAGQVEEILYLNFDEPTQLHDYKYYGKDYRERWNNKRIITRTIEQLKGMDVLRRNMIIDNIQQHFIK